MKPLTNFRNVVVLLSVASSAQAQSSLRAPMESIFLALYAVVGVAGCLAFLVSVLNWKLGNFFGAHDPKKNVMTSLIATGLGFATVTIIMFIKGAVAGGASISGV